LKPLPVQLIFSTKVWEEGRRRKERVGEVRRSGEKKKGVSGFRGWFSLC